MGKTFDEWYKQNEHLEDWVYDPYEDIEFAFSYNKFKEAMKICWDEARKGLEAEISWAKEDYCY